MLLTLAMCAAFMAACIKTPSPESIARVEQNFDKIEPGMAEAEVEALVGEPFKSGTYTFNVATPKADHLKCIQPPCSWDIWALNAAYGGGDDSQWPIVAFDRNSHRVIKAFRGDIEFWFAL